MAALPKDAAGYEIAPPKDFKVPDGLAIDEKHPLAAPVRAIAHKHQLPQEVVSDLVQAQTEIDIAEHNRLQTRLTEEKAKMGPNGSARMTALRTWLVPHIGADRFSDWFGDDKQIGRLPLAADVEVFEKLQQLVTNPGGSTFKGNGRDTTPTPVPKTLAEAMWPSMQGKAS